MSHISHLSIIMDGNGRWANERGLARSQGHLAGVRTAFEIIKYVSQKNIDTLSLFAFSKENWKRPRIEVNALMGLATRFLNEKLNFFSEFGIKVKVIGDRNGLPESVIRSIDRVEAVTSHHKKLNLLIALNYSGQYDIMQAIKKLNRLEQESLSPALFENLLLTKDFSAPDLILRTGGENRLSNFFLWQASYAEIHFEEKHWPDFTSEDLDRHLEKYFQTERRFGKTSAQMA